MVQWVEALTAKPENQSSFPDPYCGWKKRTESNNLSSDLHRCTMTRGLPHV